MSRGARALRAIGTALAGMLLLAGCGGIPTAGPVVAGPAADELDPEFVVSPNGPVAGADPTGILNGFMQAVRAPQADYQVARQFLTPQLAQTWDPNAGVAIRSGAPELTLTGTGSAPRIVYAFPSAAAVDSAGRYRAVGTPGTRSLEFSFAQVGGEWRISAAPNVVVLGEASFARAFAQYALYFFDPSGRYLVPDVRWFAARSSTPSAVVSALLGGPDDWLRHSVVTDFPVGTTLGPRSVVVAGGRATVDLSSQAAVASPVELDRMHQQLVASLDVADVTILADGVPLRVDPVGAPAEIDPSASGPVLVGTASDFGHAGADGIVSIPGLSSAVVAADTVAATVAADQRSAALLGADGVVRRATAEGASPVDERGGLVAPSLDGFGWIWSAGVGSPLEAFDANGGAAGLASSAIPADASVVALAVSRDSTRLVVGLSSPAGPRLLVLGIVRVDGVPTALDPPLELPVTGPIASVAWVDSRSLVVVSDATDGRTAQIVGLGAPGSSLGPLPADAVAVGGRGGAGGVRVLADGVVLAPGGNDGWTDTGITAVYLGVQQ